MSEKPSTFHATCHCKTSTLSFTVPTCSLPLPTHFCHCSICRRTHGTLCTIHTPIPKPEVNLSSFTAYASSSYVVRYFCSTCGAHMLDRAKEDGKEESWCVATSLVDADEQTWSFTDHICLDGTVDGGLAGWLAEIEGKRLRMWRGKPTDEAEYEETGDWRPGPAVTLSETDSKSRQEDALVAKCHCGGVEFHISRPLPSAFTQMPASLVPADKNKWYGLTEACNSCRLVSGCAVIAWMFPLTSHITLPDGSPYRPDFGTAKIYKSSEGVERTFCGRCGAMVVYATDERGAMVDVAAGLLMADGARAEEWVEWRTGKVGWERDCRWKGMLKGLKDGLRACGGKQVGDN
ncbi:hypothetical protein K458DRAFT_421100 [Lentithecium fluviatile CBS 122367]|uniref:CENP-V/GFA domain-containing protein n=1 Tax=Lentithecium fluviatile CBS 122367 TaxID=1168545 RepID=A0A6G1IS08_9PLEO|nr:hypothetical protein K458DRAFT_421100 [Lentithecium fluviatile CBS 122367]